MINIRETLSRATRALAHLPQTTPSLEAEILLAETLGKARSFLFTWPELALSPDQERGFSARLERRLAGEPIAYILGYREFWSLDLRITPDVLIPRPETELLVELALEALPADAAVTAADLGTGSGAIAAAIAHERPGWQLYATDISAVALAVAKDNFQRLGLGNVRVGKGAWCAALPVGSRLDLIVSNPPYVAEGDSHLQQGDPDHEPRTALAAGPDGLDAIRQIANQAPRHLKPEGLLLLEHGWEQGESVRECLVQAGFQGIETRQDLAGLDRATLGRLPD